MKKSLAIAVLATTGMVSISAHADNTITFNGEVVANTCTISGNGGAADFTVSLPNVSASTLQAANSASGNTAINLALTNCTPDTGNVRAFFTSTPTIAPNGALNIVPNGGTGVPDATNVQLRLTNSDLTVIDASKDAASQGANPVSLVAGAAILQYGVEYYSQAGSATAGKANSYVNYTLDFQ
ncbi:MAG: fimbrial protein [Collimonas sp.]|uniref:fimbrial protein n=1 Tax=Collimonas sp. TaxID=1963772 RepID=UPI0032665C95